KNGGEVATSKPIEGDVASKNVSTAGGGGEPAEAAGGYHGGMETRPPAAPFRLGIAEGVIPRKWVRLWGERIPQVPLDVVALPASGGEAQVRAGAIQAGLVRLPVAPGEPPVHAIPLYEEEPVVVVPTDHYLCAAERVQAED